MKKLLYISSIVLLAACSQPTGKEAKKAELDKLKKEAADLNAKITKLQAEVGTTDSVKSTDVAVMEIKPTSFTNYIDLQGRIDAKDNVLAFPQATGVITAIHVKAGDHVTRGQILAQLDNSVLKQNIEQATTQVNLMKTLYDRQKNLWDQKIGTEVQYVQAKSNLENAEKQVASLKQQSDMYRIISPINGTIDQMDLKLGYAASPANASIRIVNTDYLKVKADVPESYAGKIHAGESVKVVIPDANDSVMAKITFAAKVIDASSRSFAIEIQLPGSKRIRPNMTAILKVASYSNNKALVIPVKAIQKSESGDFVFVNENNVAKKKNITTGASYAGKAEVTTGLAEHDKLITEGANEVEDGDKIKVIQSVN